MHALSVPGIAHVQFGDHPMRHRRAEEHAVQCPLGGDVIDIAAIAGQETVVFHPFDRLAFPELFHLTLPLLPCLFQRNSSGRTASVQRLRPPCVWASEAPASGWLTKI